MLTKLLFDSFLFWSFLVIVVITVIYTVKTAKKMFEYEKQVDRSWNDLLSRADEMIKRLNDLLFEVQSLKDSTKATTNRVKKITQKIK